MLKKIAEFAKHAWYSGSSALGAQMAGFAEVPDDILTTLSKKRLDSVKWIFGELHGHKEHELLAYLTAHDFNIDGRKTLAKQCWKFHAVRLNTPGLMDGWRTKNLQW